MQKLSASTKKVLYPCFQCRICSLKTLQANSPKQATYTFEVREEHTVYSSIFLRSCYNRLDYSLGVEKCFVISSTLLWLMAAVRKSHLNLHYMVLSLFTLWSYHYVSPH